MSNPKGDFIWYELLTTDADAAQRFYGDVVGWTVSDSGQPGMDYRILDAGDGQAGGLMQINEQMPGAKPVWLGYVGVPDVDGSNIPTCSYNVLYRENDARFADKEMLNQLLAV